MAPKQPELTLRNRLTRVKYDKLSRQEQLALFVRTWNAAREGRTLGQVVVVNNGFLSNENFPRPK